MTHAFLLTLELVPFDSPGKKGESKESQPAPLAPTEKSVRKSMEGDPKGHHGCKKVGKTLRCALRHGSRSRKVSIGGMVQFSADFSPPKSPAEYPLGISWVSKVILGVGLCNKLTVIVSGIATGGLKSRNFNFLY